MNKWEEATKELKAQFMEKCLLDQIRLVAENIAQAWINTRFASSQIGQLFQSAMMQAERVSVQYHTDIAMRHFIAEISLANIELAEAYKFSEHIESEDTKNTIRVFYFMTEWLILSMMKETDDFDHWNGGIPGSMTQPIPQAEPAATQH